RRAPYLAVRLVRHRNVLPRTVWPRRYAQMHAWERALVDERTTIAKFFLNIAADEQRQRFQERVDDPTKQWKFKMGDLAERKLWDDYQAAFEAALERCSTDLAPWYVIPANRNWFRNLAVAEILGDVLAGLKPAYPPSSDPIPAGFKVT